MAVLSSSLFSCFVFVVSLQIFSVDILAAGSGSQKLFGNADSSSEDLSMYSAPAWEGL